MATIPIGNRVSTVAPDAQQNRVITMDPRAVGGGGQQIADTVQRTAMGVLEQQTRENKALARVKASNALFERETQIGQINSDLAEQVRLGNLSHDKLEEAYTGAVAKLDPLKLDGLDEAEREGMGLAQQRLQMQGQEGIRKLAIGARTDAAKGDLAVRMDLLGKEAAMPGADIAKLNARLDSEDVDMAGRLAFGEMWSAKKQEAKDSNWTTQATQRVVEARDGLGNLQKIEHDLTAADGFYAGKLDPEKRNQLLNTVTGRIYQVKEHQQRQAEMREMKAERALTQMDRQAATGVPPTPADQQRWKTITAGTSVAGEFNTRMAQMSEVQTLLRAPMAVQQQYIDRKRQQMAANGGSVAEQANVNRLQTAVDNNAKLLRDDPLTFNALRTGADVAPLDITGIMTQEGQQRLVAQIGDRFDTVNSVRKAYGPEVSRVPFKAGELTMLSAALSSADDGMKLQIFGAIAAGAPSGADFAATAKALAPDQPITVLAGMAQFRGLKGKDGTNVPQTLLAGAKVLTDKSVPMPKENLFRAAFDEAVGNSLVPGTQQREQGYLAFKSLYAGKAAAKGLAYTEGDELDKETTNAAIEMATGGITERGGAKVIKPYEMDEKTFGALVDMQLEGLAMHSKLPIDQLEDMPLSPVPGREGSYYLMNAGRVQMDPATNQPMVVKVK